MEMSNWVQGTTYNFLTELVALLDDLTSSLPFENKRNKPFH